MEKINKKKFRMIFNVVIGIVFVLVIYNFYTTFSLESDYQFASLVYQINDNYIEGVSPYTEVDLFYKYFDMENCSIKVMDNDNQEVVDGYVSNGSKTILYDVNGDTIGSYINIIQGDYDADGEINDGDFEKMGKCLVEDCDLSEADIRSMDIDLDNEFHVNDLTLLDKAITSGYQSIALDKESLILQTGEVGRLVSKIEPSYGLNQNAKWISNDTNIVTVDEAGRLVGGAVGETKVQAYTMDDKLMAEATIVIDNTIQLELYEGIGYVGGNDIHVKIKSIDYEGITCSVGDEKIASCEIVDEELVIHSISMGNTEIVVKSPNYGEVTYKLTVYSVYLNVMPKYLCTTPGNIYYVTVGGFYTGELSYQYSDNEIIKNSYMEYVTSQNRNMLRIEFGAKQGRATLSVTESNGNTTNVVTIDVSKISIPQIGSVAKVGEEVSTTIAGDHYGTLTCVSDKENLATCRIEGNQLIVTTHAVGMATINVYNQFTYDDYLYDCGSAQFLVVIQE